MLPLQRVYKISFIVGADVRRLKFCFVEHLKHDQSLLTSAPTILKRALASEQLDRQSWSDL